MKSLTNIVMEVITKEYSNQNNHNNSSNLINNTDNNQNYNKLNIPNILHTFCAYCKKYMGSKKIVNGKEVYFDDRQNAIKSLEERELAKKENRPSKIMDISDSICDVCFKNLMKEFKNESVKNGIIENKKTKEQEDLEFFNFIRNKILNIK